MNGTCIAEVKGKTIGTIEPGQWFGETAAILGAERTATVRTVTQCEIYIFKGVNDGALIQAMKSDEKMALKLIETLAMRVLEASRRGVAAKEGAEGDLERYRKAISGTLFALEKITGKYKAKPMIEVREHLAGTSGISMGSFEDVNRDFFPSSKMLF